jgi:hypothetical protein
MKWFSIIITLVCFASACNNTTKKSGNEFEGKEQLKDTAAASFRLIDKDGYRFFERISTDYKVVKLNTDGGELPVMLKITETELSFLDSAGKEKAFYVEARSLDGGKTLWTQSFKATEIELAGNLMFARLEGFFDEEDYVRVFSLPNGKEFLDYSYDKAQILFPGNKDKRIVGYVSQKTAGTPLKKIEEENLLGVVQLASGDALLDRVFIKIKRSNYSDRVPRYVPEIVFDSQAKGANIVDGGKTVIMMGEGSSKSAKADNVSLNLVYYIGDDLESTTLSIPIKNDRFMVENARFDSGIFELLRPK